MKKFVFFLTASLIAAVMLCSCMSELGKTDQETVPNDTELLSKSAPLTFYAHINQPLAEFNLKNEPDFSKVDLYKMVLATVLADRLTAPRNGDGDIFSPLYQSWEFYTGSILTTRAAAGADESDAEMRSPGGVQTKASTRSGGLYDPEVYVGYAQWFNTLMAEIVQLTNFETASSRSKRANVMDLIEGQMGVMFGSNEDATLDEANDIRQLINTFFGLYDNDIDWVMYEFTDFGHYTGDDSELMAMSSWLAFFIGDESSFATKRQYYDLMVGRLDNNRVTRVWNEDQIARFARAMAVALYSADFWSRFVQDNTYSFEVSPISISEFPATGGSFALNITTDSPRWDYTLPDFVTFEGNTGNEYTFSVSTNILVEPRSEDVVFTYDDGLLDRQVIITISQKGVVVNFSTNPRSFNINSNSQQIELTVSTNMPYELVSYPNFMNFVSESAGRYKFSVSAKQDIFGRSGNIVFKYDNGLGGTTNYSVHVYQKGIPVIFEVQAGYTRIGGEYLHGQTVWPYVIFIKTNYPDYASEAIANNWASINQNLVFNSYYDVTGMDGGYNWAFHFDLKPNDTGYTRGIWTAFWYVDPESFEPVERVVELTQGPTYGPFYVQ